VLVGAARTPKGVPPPKPRVPRRRQGTLGHESEDIGTLKEFHPSGSAGRGFRQIGFVRVELFQSSAPLSVLTQGTATSRRTLGFGSETPPG
jgi:hypothetical protein